MPFDQLLEGFRNVDRPSDGQLSAKEFTIFSRIQGDQKIRVSGMQNKLARVVNLQPEGTAKSGGSTEGGDQTHSKAFVADNLADIIGDRTHMDMLRHGSFRTVSVEHLESPSLAGGSLHSLEDHPLVFFRGEEYAVTWVGIPMKKKAKDVFRICDVTAELVHLEGPDAHGAFHHKDQVEVVRVEDSVSDKPAIYLSVNGQKYNTSELDLQDASQLELLQHGQVHTVLNYPSAAGHAVHLSGAGFTLNPTGVLVFNNPRAQPPSRIQRPPRPSRSTSASGRLWHGRCSQAITASRPTCSTVSILTRYSTLQRGSLCTTLPSPATTKLTDPAPQSWEPFGRILYFDARSGTSFRGRETWCALSVSSHHRYSLLEPSPLCYSDGPANPLSIISLIFFIS